MPNSDLEEAYEKFSKGESTKKQPGLGGQFTGRDMLDDDQEEVEFDEEEMGK
jgi:hypothetical protein